jgi:hypothetical protein
MRGFPRVFPAVFREKQNHFSIFDLFAVEGCFFKALFGIQQFQKKTTTKDFNGISVHVKYASHPV